MNLANIEKWKELNKESKFSIFDYIYYEIKTNKLSTDIYFAFKQFFWPDFVYHDDYVFLAETFSVIVHGVKQNLTD